MSYRTSTRTSLVDSRVALPISRDFGVYVEGFVSSLEILGARVEMGWELFKTPSNQFDFLIIQWPEWIAYVLKMNTEEVLSLLEKWKEAGVRLGVVAHNSEPHKHYKPAIDLYSSLEGVFDFAIHLEEPSKESFRVWADSHYLLPHPLVPFSEWALVKSLNAKRRDVLVLGQLRRREEKMLLLRFAIAARLRGQRLFIGGYRRFDERWGLISRWTDVFLWRIMLGVRWAWGEVAPEVMASWLSNVRFMLVHRTQHNLNSAIPYTALSNGLIPLAPDVGNMSEVVRKAGVLPFKSTGIFDFYVYLGKVEKKDFTAAFKQFELNHSLSEMASYWGVILTDELKKVKL